MRLFLCGDDDVLDVMADLSRHLDYYEVARADEPPPGPLTGDDHVVIAMCNEARALTMLGRVLASGSPGHAAIVSDRHGDSVGARAIAAAAELVAALRAR